MAFASRILRTSERNYAQVKKEALLIVFGIRKFHQFLYGQFFLLLTDHKPLTSILGRSRAIPPLAAARMQRWALLLCGYSYDIYFKPTKSHANVDGLSRLPLATRPKAYVRDEASIFNAEQIHALPVKATEVAGATRRDVLLSKLHMYLRNGRPDTVPESLLQYWRRQEELTLD